MSYMTNTDLVLKLRKSEQTTPIQKQQAVKRSKVIRFALCCSPLATCPGQQAIYLHCFKATKGEDGRRKSMSIVRQTKGNGKENVRITEEN